MKHRAFLYLLFCSQLVLLAATTDYNFLRIDSDNGLSNNQVHCVFRDSRGFVWIGTSSGLNRYDGYDFKVYRNEPGDSISLKDNRVSYVFEDAYGKIWAGTGGTFSIFNPASDKFENFAQPVSSSILIPVDSVENVCQDNTGKIWLSTTDNGLYCYNSHNNSIKNLKHKINDPTSISSNRAESVIIDDNGFIWLINDFGVLEKLDSANFEVVFRSSYLKEMYDESMEMNMMLDSDNEFWIYSESDATGAFLYSPRTNKFRHFFDESKKYWISNNIVTGIIEDDEGKIWIGTDHGGINLVDKQNFAIEQLVHNPNNQRSISQNSIISLTKDEEGIIWLGTYKKGLCYYHQKLFKFNLVRHDPDNPKSLPYDDINGFQEDEGGNLWIGTNGGGLLHYDRTKGTYSKFSLDPKRSESLSSDIVVSMLFDSRKRLWIGTYYGGLNLYEGNGFRHFRHNPQVASSLPDDNVWNIFEDSDGNIWIGTLGAGLAMLNEEDFTFTQLTNSATNSVGSDYISHITEDLNKNLWISTAGGLDVYNRQTGEFKHLVHNPTDTNSLSSDLISSVFIDSRNLVWVATYSGLTLFNPENNTYRRFYLEDGLPDNTILGLEEDGSGKIWISTTNGICRLSFFTDGKEEYKEFSFMNFTEADGLQGREFNERVVYKTSKGELLFGGADGFNIIVPENLSFNTNPPPVYITDFEVFNENVGVGDKMNGRILLVQSLLKTPEIHLKHFEDVISFEFAALNYMHPNKSIYEYKLEGFNRDWIQTGSSERKATYTNLDPGEYIFKVRATNNDAVWNSEGTDIKLVIHPPFWKTKVAIVTYVFILLGMLVFFRRLILIRERIKFRTEQEKQESLRRHELDLLKIRFFTNVSHEFRTPLSLILSPVERMLKRNTDKESQKQLKLVYRNARRLLNLVNQLLDFRRMEVQKIELKPSYGDIIEFASEIYKFFTDLAEKKNISFNFISEKKTYLTWFDHDKLEKIIFNLLSNAFKFTLEGGEIELSIRFIEQSNNSTNEIQIQVRDSGIGISETSKGRIFDRFFQSEGHGQVLGQGSGIGLSLTRDFVELHKGRIEVESVEGKGSTFTVHLPIIEKELVKEDANKIKPQSINEELIRESQTEEGVNLAKKATVLLVEDNDDFRFYLKDNLSDKYTILEAPNGKRGVEEAESHLPDLIVSDLMMPEMDGVQLCSALKTNANTSHIPIILLTARLAADVKHESFETGADDYITKPVSFEMLEVRINNLIVQRERMKQSFKKHFRIEPGEIKITSLDEKLIEKALATVEEHIDDPEFSVEKLSKELGMSRVHLYKKLTALTGKTPIEFIRIMRLKRAAQYLVKSQLTVAEVAYEVGFNDPRYFSRYFKAEFGMLPSQYIQSKKDEVK